LLQFEKVIRERVAAGTLQMGDVVVISPDRSEAGEYSMAISVNVAPTLTTHNSYLMVMSVADVVNETADSDREFFRKLMDSERLILQGLPTDLLLTLPPGRAVFASGNAYPPPLIISAMQPMLMAVHRLNSKYPCCKPLLPGMVCPLAARRTYSLMATH